MNTDTNLVVVLKTNITDPDEITDLTLTALIYNDGSGRVKFPSGNVMDFRTPAGSTFQDAVEAARGAAQVYADPVGWPGLVITEHLVPEHCDGYELLMWLEDMGLEPRIVAIAQ